MAATKRSDPAALQMVNAVNKLRIVMQNFQKGLNRAFRDTNDLLKGSDLFRKSNATSILHFFKNAIPLLTKIKNAIRFVAKAFKGGGSAPGIGGPPPLVKPPPDVPPLTSDMLEALMFSMRDAAINVLRLEEPLRDLQKRKLEINPQHLKLFEGDFQSLLKEAGQILKKIIATKKGTGSIANDFELTEQNLTQTLMDFKEIVRSGHFTVTDFKNTKDQIADIVYRLGLAQHRMEVTERSIDKAAKGYDKVTGAVGTQIKDLLKIHGREFMLGNIEGVQSFIKHVVGLNDLIIDLRKTAQFDLPPEKWRKNIIDTAQVYNTMAKPIYALPTDIAEIFVAVAKTGIKSDAVVKSLGKTIFEMSKATHVSTDTIAALGHTMTTTWRMSADEAEQFLSNMVKTSRTVNIPLDDLIERTKSLGNQFLLSFKKGDVEGKDRVRFLNDLSNAVGSLNQVGEDSTKVLSSMVTALQNTPEAAKLLAPFKVNVYAVQEALTRGNMAGAFRLLLKDMSLLKSASDNGSDALRQFAELAQIPFETLQSTIANSGNVLKTFEHANTGVLKDFASSAEYLRNLAAEESAKLGSSFENWFKRFWTNVEQSSNGAVGRLINVFYKFKDALIPAYFALKLFGLSYEPLVKIGGLILKFFGVGTATAIASTGAATATAGTAAATGITAVGTAAGTAATGVSALGATILTTTGYLLAIAAAIAAVYLVWKNWGKIVTWFQETFPNISKTVGKVVDFIKVSFSDAWSAIKTGLSNVWTAIQPLVTDVGKLFSALFEEFWCIAQKIFTTIDTIAGKVWDRLSPIINFVSRGLAFIWDILKLLTKGTGWVLKKALGLTDSAVQSLTKSLQKVTDRHQQSMNMMKKGQKQGTSAVQKTTSNVNTLNNAMKKGQAQGASAVKNTTTTVQVLGQKVDSFTNKAENMKDALTDAFDPDSRAFATYLNKAENDFGSFFKRIGAKAKAFGYKVLGHFAPDVEAAIASAAKTYNVAPNLIRSVIMQESGGNPLAKSGVGARGLMQLMPGTAKDLGLNTLEDIYDVNKNVAAGTKYLGTLLQMYGGDVNKALAAYNWGMGNVNRYLKGSLTALPAETKDYLEKVNTYLAEFQQNYPTKTDLKNLMAIAPLMDQQKTITPEPATKAAQPLPPMLAMPTKALPQIDVVAAVNESTKATKELIEVVKANVQKDKKPPILPPRTKQEDQLMALIGQYQT